MRIALLLLLLRLPSTLYRFPFRPLLPLFYNFVATLISQSHVQHTHADTLTPRAMWINILSPLKHFCIVMGRRRRRREKRSKFLYVKEYRERGRRRKMQKGKGKRVKEKNSADWAVDSINSTKQNCPFSLCRLFIRSYFLAGEKWSALSVKKCV